MKIDWHPNPFKTKVEIDDRDKQMLLLAIQNEQYSEILCSLKLDLKGKFNRPALTDLEVIKKEVNKWSDICNLDVDSEEVLDYIHYLNIEHMGVVLVFLVHVCVVTQKKCWISIRSKGWANTKQTRYKVLLVKTVKELSRKQLQVLRLSQNTKNQTRGQILLDMKYTFLVGNLKDYLL